jgi:DNA-binding CsgD family transcriptional regulator
MTMQTLDARAVGLAARERTLLREFAAQRRADSLRRLARRLFDTKQTVHVEAEKKEIPEIR